jgi:hypothetical protein
MRLTLPVSSTPAVGQNLLDVNRGFADAAAASDHHPFLNSKRCCEVVWNVENFYAVKTPVIL